MAVFKRGNVYWFHFWWDGVHVQRSTKQTNRRVAQQMEAVYKSKLAQGELGILERRSVPTLKEYESRFMDAIRVHCATKPRTIEFYELNFAGLLKFEPLANARLDAIDEALISKFVAWRSRQGKKEKQVAPGTINRSLATLRRALRIAEEWRLISRVPRIRLLAGERNRDFVLSPATERLYFAIAPEPLNSLSRFLLQEGFRLGEALALEYKDVHLEPVGAATRGYVHVRGGKTKHAKRDVPLTEVAAQLIKDLPRRTGVNLVFARDNGAPLSRFTLEQQHRNIRKELGLPADFVLHSFRHTMLTRLGEAGADAFTIMRVAGHSTVTVSQRYVHPTPETVQRAFERLELLNNAAFSKAERSEASLPEKRSPATISATSELMEKEVVQ